MPKQVYDQYQSELRQGKAKPWYDFSDLPVWGGTLPGTPEDAAYISTELAKDISPVIGPYRSGVRSTQEYNKMMSLLDEGDYTGAISPGIWSLLESADTSLSALPLVGGILAAPIDLARAVKPIFTSPAQKAVSEVGKDALPAQQWMKQLEGRGVKKDELEWTGLQDFLKGRKGNIPKTEVEDFIEANKIDVQEVVKGALSESDKSVMFNKHLQDLEVELRTMDEEDLVDYLSNNVDEMGYDSNVLDDIRTQDSVGIDSGGTVVKLGGKFTSRKIDKEEVIDEILGLQENYFVEYPNEALMMLGVESSGKAAKFDGPNYSLPGGENYRELVLTLPNTKLEKAGREVLEFEKQFNRPIVVLKSRETGDVKVEFANVDKAQEYYDTLPPQEQLLYEMETIEKKAQYIPEEFKAEHQRLRQAVADAKNEAGTYVGGHYPEDNVLAHIRFNERITPEGESMLFIEEMQSDWAHKGLDQGFSAPMDPKLRTQLEKELAEKQAELEKAAHTHFRFDPNMAPDRRPSHEVQDLLHQINVTPEGQFGAYLGIPQDEASRIFGLPMEIGALENRLAGTGVPRAPFVTDTHQWTNLGLKRMIKYAAENGFDSIAWTTGQQQGKRYHKLKPVRSMRFKKAPLLEDTYVIQAFENKNATTGSPTARQVQLGDSKTHFSEAELRKVFGDDIADEIIAPTGKSQVSDDYRSLKDIKGLEVGGEYGKFIYDKVMTEQAKKIGKKYGVKVEKTNLHGSGEKSWLEKNDDAGGYDLNFYEDGEVHQVNIPIDDKLEAEKFADTFINTGIRDGGNISVLEPGDPPKVEDVGRLRYEVRDRHGVLKDVFETKEAAEEAAKDLSWEKAEVGESSWRENPHEVHDLYEEAYELWEKRVEKSKGQEVWTMKLTDKLMKAAKEGLPYYTLVPPGLLAVGAQREQRERQSLLE